MKKLILAGAVIATMASPAFAQNYIPSQGSGNIAPMITPANPDGTFHYASTDHNVAARRYESMAHVAARRHESTVHFAARRHESTARNSYAQDVAGSGRVRGYSAGSDPDPNIQFQLNREAQEGCYTEGC